MEDRRKPGSVSILYPPSSNYSGLLPGIVDSRSFHSGESGQLMFVIAVVHNIAYAPTTDDKCVGQ